MIRAFLVAGCLALAGCPGPLAQHGGYPAEITGVPDTPGFPLKVGNYSRGKMFMYAPGMKDFSIAYDSTDRSAQNAVTFYFYPGSAALDAQFEQEKHQVTALHQGAVLLGERSETFNKDGQTFTSRVAQYRFNGVFEHQQQELYSELILIQVPSRYTKVRSTAPIDQGSLAKINVRKLMEGVNWAY